MASEIKNISLAITSETGLQDALQGVITQSFTLTDYDDGSDTPELTAGRTGEIGSALYRVEDGDFTVDVSGVSANGTYYIYVEDEGMAVTAYADDTAPTWSEEKGGFYNGNAKAFFQFWWNGTNYISKSDLRQNVRALPVSGDNNTSIYCYPEDSLSDKYTEAKALTPNGNALSSTNRAKLFIMPGTYPLSGNLGIDTQYVDIEGLGSITYGQGCEPSVILSGATISVTANDVRIKGISVGTQAFIIATGLSSLVCENCKGGNDSFGEGITSSGTFINCVGGNDSFGGNGDVNGTASGTFTNCVGGNDSFGGGGIGGKGTASGTFTNCISGNNSFAGYGFDGGIASGTFINCTADSLSFGGGGTITGKILWCRWNDNNNRAGDIEAPGIIRMCLQADYTEINLTGV